MLVGLLMTKVFNLIDWQKLILESKDRKWRLSTKQRDMTYCFATSTIRCSMLLSKQTYNTTVFDHPFRLNMRMTVESRQRLITHWGDWQRHDWKLVVSRTKHKLRKLVAILMIFFAMYSWTGGFRFNVLKMQYWKVSVRRIRMFLDLGRRVECDESYCETHLFVLSTNNTNINRTNNQLSSWRWESQLGAPSGTE